jgi:hypothetical protein
LREATPAENARNKSRPWNNTSGIPGVSFYKRDRKWVAGIGLNNRRIHLGYFDTIEEAAAVRRAAEIKYFGEFAPNLNASEIASIRAEARA